ncbi:hypothetical protein G5B36_28455 [Enterocloster aldensis]|nr:hypothetical protein [Enterocloster aldenensis]
MVRFRIPTGRSDLDKQDVFVAVNGKSYLIKRGETVELPKSVVEVLENSEAQNAYALEYMEKVKNQEIKQG